MVRKKWIYMCKGTMNNDILYRRSCLPVNPYAGGARVLICDSEGNSAVEKIVWSEGLHQAVVSLVLRGSFSWYCPT